MKTANAKFQETDNPVEEENRGVEILNISVDIGNGQRDILTVFEHDDPRLIVRNFFIKNNITKKSEEALILKVHEFIAEVVQEHQLVCMSLASQPNFPTAPCKNFGEKLYLKCLENKVEMLVANQMKRISTAKNIETTLTGSPMINKHSRILATNPSSKSNSVLKFHIPKALSQDELMLSPKISPHSNKLARKCENRIKDLYEEAEKKKKRMELMNKKARDSEFSFKPDIKHKTKPSNPEEVVDRLLKSKTERDNNIEKLRKHLSICIDPETGQKFFKPIIGRPSDSHTRQNSNVWDYSFHSD